MVDEKDRLLLRKIKERWVNGKISKELYEVMKREILAGDFNASNATTFDARATFQGIGTGTILKGRYEIEAELGRGGMGVVYKARDRELETEVAVKVLLDELAQNARAVRNLMEEAKVLMRLSHPHIMRLINFETDERHKFLVMEYIEGETLETRLTKTGRLPESGSIPLAAQICEGLAYAHKQKVIHRDIKPSNIMISSTGEAKIMDFGIARVMKDSLTALTGQLTAGTLIYMSPEQIEGRDTDDQSDIYSLGVIMYELVSGHPPFYQGDITYQHLNVKPIPLERISRSLNQTIIKCLQKEKGDRFKSVQELKIALERANNIQFESAEMKFANDGHKKEEAEKRRKNAEAERRGKERRAEDRRKRDEDLRTAAEEKRRIEEVSLGKSKERADDGTTCKAELYIAEKPSTEKARDKPKRESETLRKKKANLFRWSGLGIVLIAILIVAFFIVPGLHKKSNAPSEGERQINKWPEPWSIPLSVKSIEIKQFSEMISGKKVSQDMTFKTEYYDNGKTYEYVIEIPFAPEGLLKMLEIDTNESGKINANYSISIQKPGNYPVYVLPGKRHLAVEFFPNIGKIVVYDYTKLSRVRAIPQKSQFQSNPKILEPEMIRLSGGTFLMGSDSSEANDDEKPAHTVSVSAFSIGKYEVTQAEWTSVMGSNPFKGDRLPVEQVSWNDVQEYIRKLNAATGKNYRLPTEAEWEYACRAETTGDRYGELNSIAWYDQNSGGKTHPVGEKSPNGFGIYDMLGNVWEWCADWYGPYTAESMTNPKGPNSGVFRVFRGGSWLGIAGWARASNRLRRETSYKEDYLGFRLASD